jgi:hypothetical protein
MSAQKAIKGYKVIFAKVSPEDHDRLINDSHEARMNVSQYVRHKLGLTKDYNDEK